MRIRAALTALPLAAVLTVLTACGSSPSSPDAGSSTGASGTAASSSEAAALGPQVPAATAVAAPVPANQLPTATGKVGEKPTLTFPAGNPPNSLQRKMLIEGTGATVTTGDYLVTNYLGQIWKGKVFDNSYDRKSTSGFSLGKVVPGWTVGLAGVKVGSRVMLSLPPADGYGMAGNSGAGITGTDTLVFIIDVVTAYGPNAGGQTDAKKQTVPAGLPTVTGALGKAPTIAIGSAPIPTKTSVTVLALGTGAKVTAAGEVLVQIEATQWDGKPYGTTWPESKTGAASGQPGTGPQAVPVTSQPFTGLKGVPAGSRVLILNPATTDQTSGQATPASAFVVDILAQTTTA